MRLRKTLPLIVSVLIVTVINSNSLNITPSNEVEQKETSKESELKERFEQNKKDKNYLLTL